MSAESGANRIEDWGEEVPFCDDVNPEGVSLSSPQE